MAYTTASNKQSKPAVEQPIGRDTSGIALFMVLSAVSVLAVLVSEFTYIAQIGQMIAYGGLDQTKAHYLAKSGLKISLLRLKAYQQVKNLLNSAGGSGVNIPIPKSMIDKIWSFPFMYPIPSIIPGLSLTDRQMIDKFQKESGLEGKFTANITSESSKYNLNLLLPGFAPTTDPSATPSATPTPSASTAGTTPNPTAQPTPSSTASYSPETARNGLYTYLESIMKKKFEEDMDFANLYRDFRLDDLLDQITAWADRSYERRTSPNRDKAHMKRAPFYAVSELHMLPAMDDDLYQLFEPSLTTSTTAGININTMQENVLHALIPQMTIDDRNEFFKYRDLDDGNNIFKNADDFYKYLQNSVPYFKDPANIDDLKKTLTERSIQLVTDETQFKITVQATVNTATRTFEAWVTLNGKGTGTSTSSDSQQTPKTSTTQPSIPPLSGPGPSNNTPAPDSGLAITFMRIY